MVTIHITDRDGIKHALESPTDMGLNIMELAKAADLPVEGTCGGLALCASCHIYIISKHVLREPSDDEIAMLDQAFYVESNSRLGCQIKITEELDELELCLAPN